MPLVDELQLVAAIRLFFLLFGSWCPRAMVCRSPLPGVGKLTMVVVRVQGRPLNLCTRWCTCYITTRATDDGSVDCRLAESEAPAATPPPTPTPASMYSSLSHIHVFS